MAALALHPEQALVDGRVFVARDAIVRGDLQVGIPGLEGGGHPIKRTGCLGQGACQLPIGKADEIDQFFDLQIVEHTAFIDMPGCHLRAVGGAGDGAEEQVGVDLCQGGVVEGGMAATPSPTSPWHRRQL